MRPFVGLLVAAGIGPLAAILLILTRTGSADLRFSEVLILALIGGWSAHRVARPRRLAVSQLLFWASISLVAAAVASAIISFARYAAQQPGTPATSVALAVLQAYLSAAVPLTSATLFAEGLMVVLIVADVCAGRPERRDVVLRMMAAGAAGAGLINVLRIIIAAASHAEPWDVALGYFWSVRVNVQYGDLNAAGSYFAMMLFIAAGLLFEGALVWTPVVVLIGAGLWLSGSRTALAASVAAMLAALGVQAIASRRQKALIFTSLVIVAIVAGALWYRYPREKNVTPSVAWQSRVALSEAALKMAQDHPVFGVGLGRFYELSPQYAQIPGPAGVHENAHNNFLQVLAELGAPGLILFLAVIVLALGSVARTAQMPSTTFGLVMGLGVFLLTCIGGHPLLVHDVAYPFWMALGIAAAQGVVVRRATRWPRIIGMAFVTILLVALPPRVATAVRDADLEGASIGLSKWQHEPDGRSYRWAGAESAVFVPSTARWAEIPLRHGGRAPATLRVRLSIDGREADTVLLPNDGQWHTVRLLLVRHTPGSYSRIDFQVESVTSSRSSGAQASEPTDVMMVGKPVMQQ